MVDRWDQTDEKLIDWIFNKWPAQPIRCALMCRILGVSHRY